MRLYIDEGWLEHRALLLVFAAAILLDMFIVLSIAIATSRSPHARTMF